MASYLRVIATLNHHTAADQAARIKPKTNAPRQSIKRLASFIHSLGIGVGRSSVEMCTGAVHATATLTFSSTGPAANQSFTVCGTTFTAKASGATGNQWNRSDTVATSAANLAAAINASATAKVNGAVTATSSGGVVTIQAKDPGTMGNGIEIADVDLANTVIAGFSGGSEGTKTTLAAGA